MNVLDQFLAERLITQDQLETIASRQAGESLPLETILLELGVAETEVKRLFAAYYEIPSYTIGEEFLIPNDVLSYIPEDSAMHYGVAPLLVEGGVLLVGVNNPDDLQLREALNFISTKHNLPYKLVYLLPAEIKKAQSFYANIKADVNDALDTLEGELDSTIDKKSAQAEGEEPADVMEHMKEDAPVTKIVATILRYAIDGNASDIHIEPTDKKVTVRFRVDGVLQTSLELPKNVQLAVAARIKILSSMRLDERRKPQDGRFSATFDGRKIDFRVSILPTSHGEKVVMRILDNEKGVRTLEDVGVDGHHLDAIKRMLHEPYGIILISGPTGSGKSTTLYAMLAELDKATQNVLSLEDPVEYDIAGVSQSQVRPEIGYTFASGLRAALRQDPDIIMVGEIRDKETAQLAIQAALTGHLVLSTIHTNNSIGVIPRLIDMGVDPYLIAPTLKLAIAQRLSRRIKTGTGREEAVSESMRLMMDKTFSTLPPQYQSRIPTTRTILHPEPSPGSTTGLKGRIAIMEVLEVNDAIQGMILKNASEEEIYNEARKHGFMTMEEDAIIKALEHKIPFEEMNNFGSKVGMEDMTAVTTPVVDNPQNLETQGDIL
ncbi:MAG: Flp pilus assembly complex ATPase component TadA [Candidatus Pacebacteria bacterium]|jgi:type IV pilus assembly protein PilB|nr:Flp pilus assembly complex ATPase component TadA [Candidatus Paceibacterota bacterium]